jgi:Domain of unknown function (DUF397)
MFSELRWVKSAYSGSQANCAEVASVPDGRVMVRDTKDRQGPVLTFDTGEWRRFAARVKGEQSGLA